MGTYDAWRLPQLLSMLEHDSNSALNAHQVALQQKIELLKLQRERLRKLVPELSQHWDPTTSAAARAFVDNLEAMIVQIDAATEAAESTRDMHTKVAGVLTSTKAKLEKLQKSYNDDTAAARAFNAKILNLPGLISPGMTLPLLRDTAMRAHQDALDARARAIMVDADQKVTSAKVGLQPMPVIEPMTPGRAYKPQSTNLGGFGGPSPGAYLPVPQFEPSLPIASGAEPVLAGGSAAPPTTPPTALPAVPSSDWSTQTPAVGSVSRSGIIGKPSPAVRTPPARLGTPVNGIIGGERLPGGTSQVTHLTPTGGVHGGSWNGSTRGSTVQGGAVTRTSSPPDSDRPSRLAVGGWQDRSFEQYAERRSGKHPRQTTSNENWVVKEGVAPILEASPRPNVHDPGPGVIGLDR